MKQMKKLLMLLAMLTVLIGLLAFPAAAQDNDTVVETFTYVNPLYADIIDVEEIEPIESIEPIPHNVEYVDVNTAGAQFRQYMVNRTTSFTIYVDSSISSNQALSDQILAIGTAHTGVPTEGDYLSFQFGSLSASARWNPSQPNRRQLIYELTYYTTAYQEQQMNSLVAQVMNQLNVNCKSEYQKVRAIYDYICDNVTYDYAHLNNSNYKLQFTAYAALMNGTAVCQGYANLFYRMCLEVGVDARLIPGWGGDQYSGGPHAWNIVRIGDRYYNLDSTWDANYHVNDNYQYFLRTDNTFGQHYREENSSLGVDYTSNAFYSAYPMATANYDPNTMPQNPVHSGGIETFGYVAPTCTSAGYSGDQRCGGCGEVRSYGYELPAVSHSMVYHSPVASTCSTQGYIEYWHCTSCLQLFGDSQGANVLTNNRAPLDPNNHTYNAGAVIVQPTVLSTGVRRYTCTGCGAYYDTEIPVRSNPFTDVQTGSYYYDPVMWAVANGITNGTSATTFSPDQACTRGQVVTFLWRASNCPEPTTTYNPFVDVTADMYYYKAVLWAVEKGITNGTSANTFGPNDTCTRGHVVTFLHRAKGSPAPVGGTGSFVDVPAGAFYTTAVKWAVENGITTGTAPLYFSPEASCTRGHVVTFLYRAMK